MLYDQYFFDDLKNHAGSCSECAIPHDGPRKMKRFASLIILLFAFSSFAQEETKKAIQVDEFGVQCSEEAMARIDNFFLRMSKVPGSTGLILFYGAHDAEGRNKKLAIYLATVYPGQRKYDTTRLALVRGANEDKLKVQFWVVPPGAIAPRPERPFLEDKYASTTLFDHSWADLNRWSGSLDIYSDGYYDLGCDFSPNRGVFAKVLKENKTLDGYLIVYTEFGKGAARGRRITDFAIRDLVKVYKVPRNRLTGVYGGNREKPEIEFWLVPRGQAKPKPSPETPKKL